MMILAALSGPVDAQTISTIAGTGVPGRSGDGGLASGAGFWPTNIAVDAGGNTFFVDSGCSSVRRIDAASGIITTVAGGNESGHSGDGGPATSARLANPLGIAFDSAGNLYISELLRVRKVDSNGVISTVAGNGLSDYSADVDGQLATNVGLDYQLSIAVDPDDNLYIGDGRYGRVLRSSGGLGNQGGGHWPN